MGGFSSVWDQASIATLSAVATKPTVNSGYEADLRFVRIDETRSVLVVATSNYSPQEMTWTFYVIDRSAPPAFTLSAPYVYVETAQPELTWTCGLLADSTLIFTHGVQAADPKWHRLAVSSTVSLIDSGTILVPQSSLPAPYNNVGAYMFYSVGHLGFGVEYDYIVVESAITPVSLGSAISAVTLLNLVAGGNTVAIDFVAGDTFGADFVAGLDAVHGNFPPGMTYRPVSDSFTFAPKTAYISANSTSVSVQILATGGSSEYYGRAPDGHFWMLTAQTFVGTTPWAVATPVTYDLTMVELVGTGFTTHTVTRERQLLNAAFGRCEDAGGGLMMETGAGYRINDTHARAEAYNPSGYFNGPNLEPIGHAVCGMEASSAIIVGWHIDGSPTDTTIRIGVLREQPIGPFAGMTYIGSFPNDPHAPGHVPFTLTADGRPSYDVTRDTYWHPIVTFEWHWDDAIVEDAPAVTTHTYDDPSTSHFALSDSAPTLNPADWGMYDFSAGHPYFAYGPALIVVDTLGRRSDPIPKFAGAIFLDPPLVPPPQREFPRDDGLGMSTRRSFPSPTSEQYGVRRGPVSSYR